MSSIDIYSAIPVPQSKICSKCNINKSLTKFSKCKRNKDGHRASCKECDREYTVANKERTKEYYKEYQKINKFTKKEYQKEYRKANEEYRKEQQKEYQKANLGATNARNAKRRATKLKATPNWAEFDLINQLYIDCILISEMTNIKHNVDHIVPLQSDIVCGLHVLANLQILSETENKSKSNSYWPDMS